MTRFDFSPLFRSTVGFDRMMNMLEASARSGEEGYPPYNIEKKGENDYRITMAVAGFGENDLAIEVKDSTVSVSGSTSGEGDKEQTYLHRGIAARSFRRAFQLADHVHVSGANLENGLLHIDLVREVPEALKPRTIKISTGQDPRQIEASRQAA
ncbi:MAG: Hsp20 family protein [Alphaproteobacteria bacterium]|nr:Hsp20 family protein [Alphaproteobacteria bacterium]